MQLSSQECSPYCRLSSWSAPASNRQKVEPTMWRPFLTTAPKLRFRQRKPHEYLALPTRNRSPQSIHRSCIHRCRVVSVRNSDFEHANDAAHGLNLRLMERFVMIRVASNRSAPSAGLASSVDRPRICPRKRGGNRTRCCSMPIGLNCFGCAVRGLNGAKARRTANDPIRRGRQDATRRRP